MKRIVLLTVVILMVLVSVSFAQLPRGKWWKLKDISTQLALSVDQIVEIEKAFLAHKKLMIDVKATLQKEQLDLDAIFESGDLNEESMLTVVDKVEAARSEVHKTRYKFYIEIRKILSKDQYLKLLDKKDAIKKLRRKRMKKSRGDNRQGQRDNRKMRKDKMQNRRENMMQDNAPCPDPPCMDEMFEDDDY
ncbi:periplasmic heavy metal sensor [Thermodesulfobacteriota bacterium]